ncbi:MAG: GNAT family N-acetyltransferase [Patescibacteria group bacterium]
MIRPESASGKMLYRDQDEILSMLESGHSTFIRDGAGMPVSFCGFYEFDQYIEVGSTITNPEFRGRGLATECLYRVLDAIQCSGKEIVAFCNDGSAGLFAKAGFSERPKAEMPDEALAFCADCAESQTFPGCHCRYMVFGHRVVQGRGVWHTIIEDPAGGQLKKVAELYCQVWAEPPWDEYDWDLAEVETELSEASSDPATAFFVSMVRGEVNGFTIGYPMDKTALAAKAGGEQLGHLCEDRRQVFYVAELGVAKESRCHGTGIMLSELLSARARSLGYSRLILRTHIKAAPARALYARLGFVDTGIPDANYPDRTYWVYDE